MGELLHTIDEHRHYLADEVRVSSFRDAISEVVKPGHVVLDLGAGTGILGLLACQAGASRVYSIEEGAVIELARRLCHANGFQDRMVFIKGLSTRVDLPEKVDVILADQIGFGGEFGLIDYFSDARERFLKPGGVMIPCRIKMLLAPVQCPKIFKEIDFWNNSSTGFDVRPGRSIAANLIYRFEFKSEDLVGDPVIAGTLDLATASTTPLEMEASVIANRAGVLHGIAGWFSAQMSEHVAMSNSPLEPHPIKREHVFFPIDEPISLAEGDLVQIRMHFMPTDMVVTWSVEILGASGKGDPSEPPVRRGSFTHSTWKGMLLSKEELQRTHPTFKPKLTPLGEARSTVLNLCDGQKSLSEIEQEVFEFHPTLFRSRKEAEAFVAEVVTRYSL